jgi:hypothetical protein
MVLIGLILCQEMSKKLLASQPKLAFFSLFASATRRLIGGWG